MGRGSKKLSHSTVARQGQFLAPHYLPSKTCAWWPQQDKPHVCLSQFPSLPWGWDIE